MNNFLTIEDLAKAAQRKKELHGEWLVESDEEKHLRELAEAYHAACENYDRGVCTGRHPKTGEAIPLTPDELGTINKHAYSVRATILREGAQLGLTEKQIAQAIRNYVK